MEPQTPNVGKIGAVLDAAGEGGVDTDLSTSQLVSKSLGSVMDPSTL